MDGMGRSLVWLGHERWTYNLERFDVTLNKASPCDDGKIVSCSSIV